ncbi:hypothetical protein D9M71_60450 [compost metagenome]
MPHTQAWKELWRSRLIKALAKIIVSLKTLEIRGFLLFLFVWAWQAFRAYLFIWFLLLLMIVFKAFLSADHNDLYFYKDFPKTACGKLAGNVIEVPRGYLFFPPWYEGDDPWEKGFAQTKKGCDANLVTLDLDAHWPGMFPAGWTDLTGDRVPGHIQISLEGVVDDNNMNLPVGLGIFLERVQSPLIPVKGFNEGLGLFHMRGFEENKNFSLLDIYWKKDGHYGFTIINCTSFLSGPYSCEQKWYFRKYKIIVSVTYRPEYLRYWAIINKDVESFIVEHFK